MNPITPTIPFDAQGKQHGFLRLPDSRDTSAWGSVMIPITVISKGEGPTALLTGANHGDEYEGPIALQSLAHELNANEVSGRIIIVPYMNTPAFLAARRTSPLDGGNLNRSFPGDPKGGPTEKIADYFQSILLPMADIVLDFHSGGKTLDFVPFAAAHRLDDTEQEAACIAAMRAFNAPYSMILREMDATGMYDTTAEEAGKVFVTTELGGGGSATSRTAGIARKGVRNVLKHAGILSGVPEMGPSIDIDTSADGCFHISEQPGLIEYLVELGDDLRVGDPIARVWSTERSGQAPQIVPAQIDGIFAARHFPGLIGMGDCLALVAQRA